MSSNQSSNEIWSQIPSCRICDSAKLSDVLDLGTQPPANSLRANLSDPLTDVPLKIVQCDACCTVQLTATIDPEYLFSNYVWVTATSATANSYSEYFCNELLKRIPNKTPFVVEVASNDGTFLREIINFSGSKVIGVDPSKNISNIARKKNIKIIKGGSF